MPTEPQAMVFDTGRIAKDLQAEFKLFDRDGLGGENRATPEHLKGLLQRLSALTRDVMAKRDTLSDWMPDAAIEQWDADMLAWRGRLESYHQLVDDAPAGDRSAVVWTVTAPLLLGLFGGEASKLPQRPMDAVTPFSLANQLEIDRAWRDERLRLFGADVKAGLVDSWWKIALVGVGGAVVIGVVVALVRGGRR